MLKSKLRKTGVCLHFCTRSPENACYNSTTFPTLSTLFLRSVPVCPPEALSFLPRFARFYSIYLYRTGRKVHFFRSKIFFVRGAKMHFSTGFTKAAQPLFRRKKRMRANGGGRKAEGLRRGYFGAADGGKRRGSEAVSAVRFRAVSRPPFTRFSADFHPVFARFSSLLYIEDKTRPPARKARAAKLLSAAVRRRAKRSSRGAETAAARRVCRGAAAACAAVGRKRGSAASAMPAQSRGIAADGRRTTSNCVLSFFGRKMLCCRGFT